MVETLKFPTRNSTGESNPGLGKIGQMNAKNRSANNVKSDRSTSGTRTRAMRRRKSSFISSVKDPAIKKRLKSYALYSMSIKNIIFIWPILYLLFHAIMKYLKGSENYCKFLDPKTPDAINVKNILTNSEINCWWVITIIFSIMAILASVLIINFIMLAAAIDFYAHPWKIFTVYFE